MTGGPTLGAAIAALLATVAAGNLYAQPRVAAAVGDDSSALLVGPSAELYPAENPAQVWARDGAGGVSVDVIGVVRAGGTLYAVGRSTPLFVRVDKLWYAAPLPNRGRVALSAGAPLISVGRHVYGHDGSRWKRIMSARSTITALWASSAKSFYVATEEGNLARGDGRTWHAIRSPLPAEDPIVRIHGAGSEVLAVAQSQTVLRVTRSAATALSTPDEAGDLQVTATGTVGGRPVVAAIRTGQAEKESSRQYLLRTGASGLEIWHSLDLDSGDPIAVILDAGGEPVVVTSGGVVRRRQANSWVSGQIRHRPPPAPAPAGSAAGPAKSR